MSTEKREFVFEGQKFEVDVGDVNFPWHVPNPARQERWKNWFEGDNHLDKDPVLNELGVPKAERARRRWMTEHLLDQTIQNAAKNIAQLQRTGALTEAEHTTGAFSAFTTWAVPMIRKLWVRQLSREVMSFQSGNQPTGYAFTMDHQYSSTGAYAAGTSIYQSPDPTYSDDNGEGVAANKLRMRVTSDTITCDSKKLLTDWTIEALQNLMAYHGLALEPEIMTMLGKEIIRERDRESIDGCVTNASSDTSWDPDQPMSASSGWSNATPKEYQEELGDAIIDAEEEIFKSVYERPNTMLCGPTFGSRLMKLSRFRLNNGADPYAADYNEGSGLLGTWNMKMRVFIDPYFADDQALLCYKSGDWKKTGAVHYEFVPLWVSPTIPDSTFTFAKGVLNRSADFYKNGDFYATVTVA